MQKYLQEEKAASDAARAMKDRIAQNKQTLGDKKKDGADEQMKKYIDEEKAGEEAARAMKERIAQQKKRTGRQKEKRRRRPNAEIPPRRKGGK